MIINITINRPKKVNILLSKKSAFISFPYIYNVIEYIKKLTYRYYDPETKVWEIQESDLLKFVNTWSKYYQINICDEYVEDKNIIIDNNDKYEIPKDYQWKTKPFDYQIKGIEYGLNHNSFLLGDTMGLGKTFQSLNIANIKSKSKVLIICCVNSIKYNWLEEINGHTFENGYILGTGRGREENKKRLYDLENINEIQAKFLITNIEALRGLSSKEGRNYKLPIAEKISELCRKGIIDTIIVDEFHKSLKDSTSQCAKGLFLCNSKYKIAMTGTPIINSPLDAYSVLKWLGIINTSYFNFERAYAVKGGYKGYEIIGYQNLDKLAELLQHNMLRRLKEDVLELPEKTYKNEYIELSDNQRKLYEALRNDMLENINDIIHSPSPLAKIIDLKKVTGMPNLIDENLKDNVKQDRLLELVEEIVSNDNKCIIFSEWTSITKPLYKLLSKYNPAYIDGDISVRKRQLEVERFQNDKNCKLCIGTTGSMGTGLTMTAASYVIFYDMPWTKGLYEQAVDRCHRIGQKTNVTIYNLICKDTIDEKIYNIVEKKGKVADYMVDGKVEKVDKTFIKNLLSVDVD